MTTRENIAGRAGLIDQRRFGPWALVTGASAGIGKEFAHQLAAQGLNLVLTARRGAALEALAATVVQRYGVACRPLPLDLTGADAMQALAGATADLDIGLVVSNAGDAVPTDTEALAKLGIENPPMKPLPVRQCVTETLAALQAKRARIVPGRLVRTLFGLIPAGVTRNQTAKLFEAALRPKPSA